MLVDVIAGVWIQIEGREQYEERLAEVVRLLEQPEPQQETEEQYRERRRAEIAARMQLARERGGV